MTWQTSLSHVTRSGGGWGKTGKRSLALKLQIMACDDKRGPNKTQHPSLLNEMSGEGEWGKDNLLPKDISGYRFPRNAFHWPVELQWWKMWIQLGAVKVFIWINYNSYNNKIVEDGGKKVLHYPHSVSLLHPLSAAFLKDSSCAGKGRLGCLGGWDAMDAPAGMKTHYTHSFGWLGCKIPHWSGTPGCDRAQRRLLAPFWTSHSVTPVFIVSFCWILGYVQYFQTKTNQQQ